MTSKSEKRQVLLNLLDRYFLANVTPNSQELTEELTWDHETVVGFLKSFEMQGFVSLRIKQQTLYSLTDEGKQVATNGSPEYSLIESLRNGRTITLESLKSDLALSRGAAVCLKNQWISKAESKFILDTNHPPTTDSVQIALQTLDSCEDDKLRSALMKRKLISKSVKTTFDVLRTDEFSTNVKKQIVDLDKHLLTTGEWKSLDYKPYNWNASGIAPTAGTTHPLVQTMNLFRSILMQMAFQEMDTRRWVESAFWNFDALFQPQTHPVRDVQDTFFLKSPAKTTDIENSDYMNSVKRMHEKGDHESLGWECPWSIEEASKLLLRTHTTAVTSRLLSQLAKEIAAHPTAEINKRYFSIDRVFRNETLDATHLAEFHQVEGIVASRTASLSELMAIIKTFFSRIGIHKIKFKPAYNPYTEPSMEIFGYHPLLKRWTEIGNSGVFRPEMLRPMNLPLDVLVLGWGLSLERPTMINHNIKDIRELFGPRAKLTVF